LELSHGFCHQVIGTKVRETREPLEREIQFLRRELDVVRMEVNGRHPGHPRVPAPAFLRVK